MVVEAGLLPGALEIMDKLAIEAAEAAVNAGYPHDCEGLLIIELDGETSTVESDFNTLMGIINQSGSYEVRIAKDNLDRQRIWKGRKSAFSAVGRLSPDYIVQDGVVPRGKLGEALAEIKRLGMKYNLRVANVFHAGDGNLHPLILFDGREEGALHRAEDMASEILDLCIRSNGSITGEHGIGMEKRDHLPKMFDVNAINTMKSLREKMDPRLISNRGKVFLTEALK
jgi:glycolate oxidase